MIRSGSNTNFWLDNWLGQGTLRFLIEGPLTLQDCELKVRDLWVEGVWDLGRTSLIIPPNIKNMILSHPARWFNDEPDGVCWNSSSGLFSSEEAHLLCMSRECLPPLDDWKWIWKIPANPCVTHFRWLVEHDRLATKHNLFTRSITPDPFWFALT